MAGIVATQCGVPLQFVIGEIYSIQQARIPFLQNATCLGDILKEAGFHNVFLGGADLDFGAKNEFLIRHGYDETYGALQWKKNGVMQVSNEWGMYDDDLFRTAKIKLLELKRANRPFNLTLLTVDTHQPSGYYSKTCIEHGAKRFEDIVKCTSWQLADFIAFANEHDLFKTTNFVILGDHLAHGNVVNSKLQSSPNRRIFNKFIADNLPPKNREKITPFDLFPSMLEFIGIDVPDNRLALGCSALFNKPSPCIPQSFTNNLPGELAVSSSYRRLWVK
jgi:phosphoglycerol transferase